MIYFDAAATTLQKPPQVRKMAAYAMEHYASPGRGGYRAAMLASDAVYDCRKELAELLNLPPAQCTALLRRMADRGELLLTGKRYALPPKEKPLETN